MPWVTYVPNPALSETDNPDPLDRLTLRRGHEAPQYYKAVLRMAGGFDPALKVGQGNHHIRDGKGQKLPSQVLKDLELFHFPLRSVDQLLAKGTIGWEANQRRTVQDENAKEAYQWKRLHDIAQRNERPSAEMLLQEALLYAQDAKSDAPAVAHAHGVQVQRKFSDGRFMPAEQLIAQSKSAARQRIPPLTLPSMPQGTDEKTGVHNAFEGDCTGTTCF